MKQEVNENKESLVNNNSNQEMNSYDGHPLPYENIKQLDAESLEFGTDDKNSLAYIMDCIAKGITEFETKRLINYGTDKVVGVLYYSRNDGGNYELERIKAILYHTIKLDPIVINGIDIKKLEAEMMTMDWGFEKFRWGREVEDSLRLISEDEDGKRIAVALWNNSVPSLKYEKPDFIESIENDLGMYITRGFSGDENKQEIYSELKVRQLIDENLSILPIDAVHNPKAKLAMIEHLANDKFLSLQLLTCPTEMTELFFKWKSTSKELEISDEEGNLYYPDKGKFCKRSDSQDESKVVSQKDIALLQKHRHDNSNGIKR